MSKSHSIQNIGSFYLMYGLNVNNRMTFVTLKSSDFSGNFYVSNCRRGPYKLSIKL